MRPYYSDELVKVYHGDCCDILPELGEEVDLILTDPPYGKKFRSNRGQNFEAMVGDENTDMALCGLALALKRLRKCRHIYVFGEYDWSDLPIGGQQELIWDKRIIGMGDVSAVWGPQHEKIMFGVYVPSKANRRQGYGKLSARLRKGSVLCCQRKHSRGVKHHPTEKPVLILRQMIESSSMIGELVLDPFMGCGSTLIAAIEEDRRAIGIEIEEKYCEIAAKRAEEYGLTGGPNK